jgi:hypothetical protein
MSKWKAISVPLTLRETAEHMMNWAAGEAPGEKLIIVKSDGIHDFSTTSPEILAALGEEQDRQILADLGFPNGILTPPKNCSKMQSGKPLSDVLHDIYRMCGVAPLADPNGDKLIDRIADLIQQRKNTNAGLSEKNKELSAQNALLLDEIDRLRNKNTQLNDENKYLNDQNSHPLQGVFDDCLYQVSSGKGEERHGHGKPFMKQPWVELGDTYGTGLLFGQAAKKLSEAQSLPTPEARLRERIGAINYIAMGILHERINTNPAED